MKQTAPQPIPTLIPASAPFSVEPRPWLNGFFAGLLSLDGISALSPAETAALMNDVTGSAKARGPLDDGDDGQTPWHDPAMPLPERMQLADNRPRRRRMMAAMGQQDCGQCGYNCEDYANAIFLKSEERLNLCVPGGKETARMLKTLYAEFGAIPAAKPAATKPPPVSAKEPAPQPALAEISAKAAASPSRDQPDEIVLLSRTRLTNRGSAKETWHVELDLGHSAISYAIGDSLGVFSRNHPALNEAMIAAIGGAPA